MAGTTQNKAIFEINVQLDEVNRAIDKADDLEKAFLESQRNILRQAKANNLKAKRELDRQLKEKIISRKEFNKKVIALDKQLAAERKTIAKNSGFAKTIIEEGKRALKSIKSNAAKESIAIKKQLRDGVITRKKFATDTIRIEADKQRRIIALNKKTKVELQKFQKQTTASFKKASKKQEAFSKKSKKGFGDTSKAAGGLLKKLGAVAAVVGGLVIVARGIQRIASASIDAANRVEAFEQRATTVFGEALPGVRQELEAFRRELGLTATEAIGAAGATADLLIPLGATRAEAAKMSVETLKVAGALKQFSGDQRSAVEIARVLTASYLGEREGLKSLGIAINETDVKQELLARGTSKLTGNALALERAMVTQELIFRKSTDARNAFADSTDNAQQRTNKMSAAMKSFAENGAVLLAAFFAPFQIVITNVFNTLNSATQALKEFFNVANAAQKATQAQATSLVAVKNALEELAKKTNKTLQDQEKEIQLREQLSKLLDDEAEKDKVRGKGAEELAQIARDSMREQARLLENSIIAQEDEVAIAKVKNEELLKEQELIEKTGNSRIKNSGRAFNIEKAILQVKRERIGISNEAADAQKELLFNRATLNILREKKAVRESAAPAIRAGGGGDSDIDTSQIDVEDTTETRLEKERQFLESRINLLRESGENELELSASILAEKEIRQEQARQGELDSINLLEEQRRAKQVEFNESNSKAEKKILKSKLKGVEKNLAREQKAEAKLARNKLRIRKKFEKIAGIVQSNAVDVAEALFSREKGAFRKLLASKIKDLAIFISKELALKAAAFFATGQFGLAAAAAAASGVVLAAGFTASRAISEQVDAENEAAKAKTEDVGTIEDAAADTATDFGDIGATTSAPVTINNITTNIENTEINNLGTFVDADRFIREDVFPTLQEIDAEKGGAKVL